MFFAFLVQACVIDRIASKEQCSCDKAKKLALSDFEKKHKSEKLNIISVKDSAEYYYFALSIERPSAVRNGNYNEIFTTGAWQYYYEKNTCKLIKIIREQ